MNLRCTFGADRARPSGRGLPGDSRWVLFVGGTAGIDAPVRERLGSAHGRRKRMARRRPRRPGGRGLERARAGTSPPPRGGAGLCHSGSRSGQSVRRRDAAAEDGGRAPSRAAASRPRRPSAAAAADSSTRIGDEVRSFESLDPRAQHRGHQSFAETWHARDAPSPRLEARSARDGRRARRLRRARVPGGRTDCPDLLHYVTKARPRPGRFQPSPFEPVSARFVEPDDRHRFLRPCADRDAHGLARLCRGASDDKGPTGVTWKVLA